MKKIVGLLFLLVCLSSCQRGKISKKEKTGSFGLQESVARLSDIPDVPFSVTIQKVVKSEQIPDDLQVYYKFGSMGKQEIKSFYMEEMERLGWELNFEFEGSEVLLEFVRPSGALCIISCRDQHVVVLTMLKKKDMP